MRISERAHVSGGANRAQRRTDAKRQHLSEP
jgi:hypothetical protein